MSETKNKDKFPNPIIMKVNLRHSPNGQSLKRLNNYRDTFGEKT